MFSNHFIQNIPYFWQLALDHFFCALNGRDMATLFKLVVDKRLKELQGHFLGQAALMQTELLSNHNHRSSGIVDAFSQQVLPEPTGLALEHIAQGFERAPILSGDSAAASAVIK